MPPPIKNSCDWFSHDNNMRNHRKVKSIRLKFVNGYAIWNMILEYLTGSDGNEFEYSEMELELMSGDFGYPSSEIKDVIDYCLKLEILFSTNNFISSESLHDRLKPVYEKRGKQREISGRQKRVNGKYVGDNAVGTVIPSAASPQSKVKESKVKKRELKKTKVIIEAASPASDNKIIDYWKLWVETWFDFYKLKNGNVQPSFDGTQGKALKAIKKHLENVSKKEDGIPIEESGLAAWKYILNSWGLLDEWLQGQFDLTMVSKKINDVINQIKNGKRSSKNKQSGGSVDTKSAFSKIDILSTLNGGS